MKNIVRKALRTGCALALSGALLCSCSAPVSSESLILSDAPAQEITKPERMSVRRSAGTAQQGTASQTARPAESITPVSAMDIMCHPCGAAVMDDGSLLVTDVYNCVIWRVADGASTVYAGVYSAEEADMQPLGGYNDASYSESLFRSPWAIAPFLDGWAVSDTGNHVVRLLKDGAVQTLNAHEAGSQTAAITGTTFEHPTGLAADDAGNLYVADTFADTIYRITPEGEIQTEATGISEPMGMCWQDGTLYIAESGQNRVIGLKDGNITVQAGNGEAGSADGPALEATFSAPKGVCVGSDGTICVADTDGSAVRLIRDGQVSTLYARDVRALEAFFPVSPVGLLNVGDDLYVCDPFARALLSLPAAN